LRPDGHVRRQTAVNRQKNQAKKPNANQFSQNNAKNSNCSEAP